MKKIYVPVIALLLLSVMCGMLSCKKNSFLAPVNTTNLTQSVIFTDSAYTEGFLANIYSNLDFAVSPSRFYYQTLAGSIITCGGLDAASDESEVSHLYATTALGFAIGSIDANSIDQTATSQNALTTCYAEIRACNQLFANISTAPLKAVNKTQAMAEARFLRAYYYFILLEHYGGVPLIGNSLYTYTQAISEKRATFDQVVTYIAGQLDSAALILPINQSGQGLGRASVGACYALKARLYLYAASPMFSEPTGYPNQGPMDIASATQKPLVGYPNSTPAQIQSRWILAKNAAYQVIESNQYQLFTQTNTIGGYGTEGAFQYLFTKRANSEYILQYNQPQASGGLAANYLEGLFNPPSRTGANGAYPYQSTVDAFPMINGKAITDPTSGYDPNNPYVNRDPRLQYSIIYNGNLLGVRTSVGSISGYAPVNISLPVINGVKGQGGVDAIYQGTTTGYYNNKMVDPQAIANGGLQSPTNRCLPIIRYAEILLNYAEAINETEGPVDSTYIALELIRKRAGILPGTTLDPGGQPSYGLAAGMSQAQMRAAIQNERQVELAYEGFRFFDVRRWLIAGTTENQQENGMEVDSIKNPGTAYSATYTIIPVRKHNFTTKMYLFPFPQSEIGKGAGLVQNPGY